MLDPGVSAWTKLEFLPAWWTWQIYIHPLAFHSFSNLKVPSLFNQVSNRSITRNIPIYFWQRETSKTKYTDISRFIALCFIMLLTNWRQAPPHHLITTRFIMILALLQLFGTKPTISPRDACNVKNWQSGRGVRTDDSTTEPDWPGMIVQNTHGRIHRDTVLLLIYNRLIYKNQSHRMRNARD